MIDQGNCIKVTFILWKNFHLNFNLLLEHWSRWESDEKHGPIPQKNTHKYKNYTSNVWGFIDRF
jgi:hypothetical protein